MKHKENPTKYLLQAELDEVVERLRADSTIPSVSLTGGDFLDVAQGVERHELIRLGVSRLHERAKRLQLALGRLATGEYGVCSECGEAIAPKRLAALPDVTTWVGCQAKLEGAVRAS